MQLPLLSPAVVLQQGSLTLESSRPAACHPLPAVPPLRLACRTCTCPSARRTGRARRRAASPSGTRLESEPRAWLCTSRFCVFAPGAALACSLGWFAGLQCLPLWFLTLPVHFLLTGPRSEAPLSARRPLPAPSSRPGRAVLVMHHTHMWETLPPLPPWAPPKP